MMMLATCHNLEFGRTDFGACGCSFNSLSNRFVSTSYKRKVIRGYCGGGGGRRLVCRRRRDGNVAKCGVFSPEAPETLFDDASGLSSVLSEKKESTSLFEAVSDDLLTLNKNLQSVSYLLAFVLN
ncbi:hypothetical protein Hanom_Chr10g00937681 [Helianthus anomalus]